MDEQDGGRDIPGVGQGGLLPVELPAGPGVTVHLIRGEVEAYVGRPVERRPVADAVLGYRRPEPVGLGHDPVGHEAPIR